MATTVRAKPEGFPPQTQTVHPGAEHQMEPEPQYMNPNYKGSGKLKGKVALISGADSGIGRAVAILYAREGCKGIGIIYYEQHDDAQKTKELVEKEGAECLLLPSDVSKKSACEQCVQKTIEKFHQLDILINHAGVQYYHENLMDISEEELDNTVRTNIHGYIFLTQAALPHLKNGSCIINTTSVNAYKGNCGLMDYSATKGAERALTYSLAKSLVAKGIRVNAVAPGPIWTPFIPSSFPEDKVQNFGHASPMKRAGQPEECAPAYVFLASELCSSYITGQTIHVNGGTITDG
jgi:NAD(P)-dependent dehydrogenase (short-subunit alcohol dehydrogenase family)